MRSIINAFYVSNNSGLLFKKYGKWVFAFFLLKGLAWVLFAAGMFSLVI